MNVTQDDYQKFNTLWLNVAQNCRHQVDQLGLAMAFKILRKYEFDEVQRGTEDHMADPDRGMFFPSPADIIKRILSNRKKDSLYKPLSEEDAEAGVRSVVARNECMFHIKKLLPPFTAFEDKEENKGKSQADMCSES